MLLRILKKLKFFTKHLETLVSDARAAVVMRVQAQHPAMSISTRGRGHVCFARGKSNLQL